jgi:signal transduction histidine kinase
MAILVIALLVFAIPLAVSAQRFYESQALITLDRRASESAGEVSQPVTAASLTAEFGNPRHRRPSYYDLSERRIYGTGPHHADAAVRAALRGDINHVRAGGKLVVAAPVSDQHDHVVGAIRVVEPDASVADPVHWAWVIMGFLAAFVLVGGWFVARRQARRIVRPVDELVDAATALGDGDFSVRSHESGIPELDALGSAFDSTAARIGTMLERERSFSADASHQLRTPLAGLRLRLENAQRGPEAETQAALRESIGDVERLEATIDQLLTLARDVPPDRGILAVPELLDAEQRTWSTVFEQAGRPLVVRCDPGLLPVHASASAIGQVLDALIDNALTHGAGKVQLTARAAPGGVAIDVSDEGGGVADADRTHVFERGHGTRTGIGLALARSLAEAEGGRLVLGSSRPATFTMILPEHVAETNGSSPTTPTSEPSTSEPSTHPTSPSDVVPISGAG